jgi:hypothetical protein
MPTASEYAAELVTTVRDAPARRMSLMRSLHKAARARRAPSAVPPGRTNEWLLRDSAEARAHLLGLGGPASSWSAAGCLERFFLNLILVRFRDGVPAYAWDPTDAEPWNPAAGAPAGTARALLPALRRRR